jgi:hypothetical protein
LLLCTCGPAKPQAPTSPPQLGEEVKPIVIKHKAGEPANRAKPRGWRLTRAMFAEFADDEQ